MSGIFGYEFVRLALAAAFLVGLVAPLVGVFLVQRSMSLIGDGIGHVALAGVAVGLLTGSAPVLTALVAAVLAAIAIEVIRGSHRSRGDIALAVMFYGGIAAGVVLVSRSGSTGPAGLTGYLFGAILTTSRTDLLLFAGLAAVILLTTFVLGPRLFAVANDEEYARASGLPATALNLVLGILTAVTVVVAMRVVGLLLVSALMILPNAIGQLLGRSFRAALLWAVALGVVCAVGGVLLSFAAETPSGGTIVLLAIAIYLGVLLVSTVRRRVRAAQERQVTA